MNKYSLVDHFRLTDLITSLYYVLIGFLVLVLISMPMLNENLLRISLYIFIILNISIFVITINLGKSIRGANYSRILIYLTVVLLLLMLVFTRSFNLQSVSASIGYLSSFFIAYYSTYIITGKKTLKYLAIVSVLLGVVFILLYFSPLAFRYTNVNNELVFYDDSNEGSLTLGYSNPNTTASLILPIQFVLMFFYKYYSTKRVRFFFLGLSVVLLYFIYLTNSRSAFIASVLFYILVFFNFRFRISRLLVAIVILSGFGFIFLYSLLYNQGIGSDLLILNKPFYSGRQEYLIEILNEASKYFVFGNIKIYSFSNLLNGILSLFASVGVVGVIIYVLFFSHNIASRYRKGNNAGNVALYGLLAIYIQSYSEGNFIVSGAYFSTLLSMLFVLSNTNLVILKTR